MSRKSLVLAVGLLAAGLALVILGLISLARGGGLAFLPPTLSATPAPTLTEPILPPPPTHTSSPAALPASATPLSSALPPTALPATVDASPSPLAAPTEPPPSPLAEHVTPSPTLTPSPTPLPAPTLAATAVPASLYSLQQRMGLGSGTLAVDAAIAGRLGFGWYLDWWVRPEALHSPVVSYMPMIRLKDGQISPARETLLAAVEALPGSLWLIGNEPDVKWQDNITAEAYAERYHDLYYLLKGRDPSCQVAIGGVSQPTPLRLQYLDRVLQAYRDRYGEPMPVDVWNVHNFILREELGSWGVDIPPGMSQATGRLYEIDDHDDMALFRQQIVEFRRWMKERGQQNKPLIVTEYGILMPAEYGFAPDQVQKFMLDTFDYFRTARDPALGYAADGGRLVQRWCWFSLQDERYPTGNLLDPATGQLTPLGDAFAGYTAP